MRPGASADSRIAHPMRVESSSSSLACRQVRHAARASQLVSASGSARSMTCWPAVAVTAIVGRKGSTLPISERNPEGEPDYSRMPIAAVGVTIV
jgi:hypothetical protein